MKSSASELGLRLFTWNDVILLLCQAFFPSSQLPHFVEPRLLRRHLSERNVLQTIEKFVTPAALLSNTLDRASSTSNCEHPGLQCDSSDRMDPSLSRNNLYLFDGWFTRATQMQTQAQTNTRVNYHNPNANASPNARNGKFHFLALAFAFHTCETSQRKRKVTNTRFVSLRFKFKPLKMASSTVTSDEKLAESVRKYPIKSCTVFREKLKKKKPSCKD